MRDFVSIIWTHYSVNPPRVELARRCLKSLQDHIDVTAELIVVDNGGDANFSQELLAGANSGRITHYIRNSHNLWFGIGRNQGASLATGRYLAFLDNDLEVTDSWMQEGVEVLKNTEKRFYTPLEIDRNHRADEYWLPPVTIDGTEYKVNTWGGSNFWMMKREDWDDIGPFQNHYVAGTLWCRRYAREGYAVVMTNAPKAQHHGLKGTPYRGYVKKNGPRIHKTLLDGSAYEPE